MTHARTGWVVVTTAVIGGVLLAGTAVSAATAAIHTVTSGGDRVSSTLSVDLPTIDGITIEASTADFSVEFDGADGSDTAVLEVMGGSREWEMRVEGSTLDIGTRPTFGIGWLGFGPTQHEVVVLHLPEELSTRALDADLNLSSGELSFEATFGELGTSVSAGAMAVSGSANTFDAEVSAGRVDFNLEDVSRAKIDVSAGAAVGELSGEAPESTVIEVSAGKADVTLPAARYDVDSDVSAGSFDNQLQTDSSSRKTVEVRVSAGEASLQPAAR